MHAVRVDGAMSLRTTLAIRLIGLVIAATKGTSNMLCHSPPYGLEVCRLDQGPQHGVGAHPESPDVDIHVEVQSPAPPQFADAAPHGGLVPTQGSATAETEARPSPAK